MLFSIYDMGFGFNIELVVIVLAVIAASMIGMGKIL